MVEQHHSCFLALEPVTGVARRARCYAFAVALLAQSVEHFHGKEKVVGSIPTEGSLCFSGGGGPPPFAGAGLRHPPRLRRHPGRGLDRRRLDVCGWQWRYRLGER